MAVGNPVAVGRRLLQLVVLKAMEGGGVALGGGSEQLLGPGERPIVLLSGLSCAGTEDAP